MGSMVTLKFFELQKMEVPGSGVGRSGTGKLPLNRYQGQAKPAGLSRYHGRTGLTIARRRQKRSTRAPANAPTAATSAVAMVYQNATNSGESSVQCDA